MENKENEAIKNRKACQSCGLALDAEGKCLCGYGTLEDQLKAGVLEFVRQMAPLLMLKGEVLVEKPNSFADARRLMADDLKDEGFRMSYRANIAMLIYDDQTSGARGESHDPPTCLRTKEGCNDIAERILKLVFDNVRG